MSEIDETSLSCVKVCKSFGLGAQRLEVLKDISFDINRGESAAITGSSGSGKSTLLHILGGLALPDSGDVFFKGKQFSTQSESERGNVRNEGLGFVYQFHHLLQEFTALENVAMPLLVRRLDSNQAMRKAEKMLGQVGLSARAGHVPGELSGGERQRVALARALVTEPSCLLADEPTGNLDAETGKKVIQLLFDLNAELGTTLVIVTHDMELAKMTQHILEIKGGKIVSDQKTGI